MNQHQLSNTSKKIVVFLATLDHVTGATGLTLTITRSKNGAAFASWAGTYAELANGWYALTADAGDVDTLGELAIHISATGADPGDVKYFVVAYDPYDAVRAGLTALPNAAAEASGGLYTRGSGAGQINQDGNGRIDGNVAAWRGTQPNALQSGRVDSYIGALASGVIAAASFAANALDAVWSTATRLLTAGTNIVLAKGTGVTGFTDLSAAQVNAEADTALADYDAPTHAELTSELATADDATLAAIAALNNLSQANVRTAVGLGSANLDTQLAAIDDYVDTEVMAIKTQTDKLNFSGSNVLADMKAVNGSALAATLIALASNTMVRGSINNNTIATDIVFTVDFNEATYTDDDQINTHVLIFTSSHLFSEVRTIVAFDVSTGEITLDTALTDIPDVGDTFIIV